MLQRGDRIRFVHEMFPNLGEGFRLIRNKPKRFQQK